MSDTQHGRRHISFGAVQLGSNQNLSGVALEWLYFVWLTLGPEIMTFFHAQLSWAWNFHC